MSDGGAAIAVQYDVQRRWTELVNAHLLRVADEHDSTLPWPPIEILRARAESEAVKAEPELWASLWRASAESAMAQGSMPAIMSRAVEQQQRLVEDMLGEAGEDDE
jgi:hypothetical protein